MPNHTNYPIPLRLILRGCLSAWRGGGVLGITLGCVASLASAQDIKSGLWEVRSKMGGEKGSQMAAAVAQMQQQMAQMPPGQRKQMQDMMAKQGMSVDADGKTSVQTCITKEMADKGEMPINTHGNCTYQRSARTGNTTASSFVCINPKSSSEGKVIFQGNESYTMVMNISTERQGKVEQTSLESSGKWVSTDCGNVKPVTELIKK